MKNLELEQMEVLEGGGFRWGCALDAAGVGLGIASGNFLLAAASLYYFMDAGCYND